MKVVLSVGINRRLIQIPPYMIQMGKAVMRIVCNFAPLQDKVKFSFGWNVVL